MRACLVWHKPYLFPSPHNRLLSGRICHSPGRCNKQARSLDAYFVYRYAPVHFMCRNTYGYMPYGILHHHFRKPWPPFKQALDCTGRTSLTPKSSLLAKGSSSEERVDFTRTDVSTAKNRLSFFGSTVATGTYFSGPRRLGSRSLDLFEVLFLRNSIN